MGKIQVVVDGQYGSTGKGAVCAYLAREQLTRRGALSAVRVAGPNAGHSAVDNHGTKWALRQIPVAAVVDPEASLYIAAGSEIDIEVLQDETDRLEAAGIPVRDRLIIDSAATLISDSHKQREADADLVSLIGSTGKGIGAARADRIMRTALIAQDSYTLGNRYMLGDVAAHLRQDLYDDATVQIEGTQGYGLGLHHPNYPQVTSSDCRAIDFLAMAGVNPWEPSAGDIEIYVTYRVYPIRVAGNSGPLHGETTWEALGLEPEKTTVTQKIRRVGLWDGALALAALRANGGPSQHVHPVLTMADQLDPSVAGVTDVDKLMASERVAQFLAQAEQDLGDGFSLVGTSDRTMVEL